MRLYPMNLGQARARLVQGGAAFAAAALIAGCGSTYRPVVTPINTSGPPAQPQSYAIVVSAPSPLTPGVATVVDYSGDSVLAQALIGVGPVTFTIDQIGGNGYTLNSDGTLSNFSLSSSLQGKNVTYSTVPTTADPVQLFSPSIGLYAPDLDGNVIDAFSGFPEAFKLAIPVASTPVMMSGAAQTGVRLFAISQNLGDTPTGVECNNPLAPVGINGSADGIDLASNTVSSNIILDPYNPTNVPGASGGTTNAQCPVFAIETPDQRRLFVLNRGSDTVSVINTADNTLDQCTPFLNQAGQTVKCHPILPLSLSAVTALDTAYIAAGSPANESPGTPPNGTAGMTAKAGPVYAEYNQATAQIFIANYDGGTISVIDVSEDEYGNDSPTFGTTYTIPVGNNPASVTVLADGSRAYTANQTDQSVTIVTLSSHTAEKTLPTTGHPRTVVSTQNSLYGKVYLAAPDSPYLTIVRTDLDIVDTTVLVEGNIVDVRVTTQNGSSGNSNVTSRRPGFGQPCFLPPGLEPPPTGGETALETCRTLP